MALSNKVIGAINFVGILLSIPIISTGIWLSSQLDNSCVRIIQWPVIILGILTLLVAIAGFIGAYWRVSGLLLFYLVGMLVMILLLSALVIFVYLVTARGSGHIEPNRAYLEYDLDDFSGWLKRRVDTRFKWKKIEKCLSSAGFCKDVNESYGSAQDFFNAHLSPLESGCCKPPTKCGFTFVKPTFWISPIDAAASEDCLAWSNNQSQLCYGCSSCKAGLLANLRREWRRANIVLLLTLIALIAIYLIGCSAFRNAQTESLFRRYKQGYN